MTAKELAEALLQLPVDQQNLPICFWVEEAWAWSEIEGFELDSAEIHVY